VWGNYGLTPEQAERGGLNPKMFNSFLDGSKPSIESTAVANATGLTVPSNGLLYPPASVEDIPFVTRPISEGGVLERKGMVEVISSLEANGRQIPYDIRMGVWVTVEGETEYIRNCFEEYNAHTDPSGRYFTLYKRWHLIGLEVGMSVASVALRGEATGVATCWNADVVATAKRDLKPGDVLDGEGGYTVWGKLTARPRRRRASAAVPLGLAHGRQGDAAGREGQSLSWADVAVGHDDAGVPTCAARWSSSSRRRC
jgi:predicted homoserine dehydrogenase-like protein